MSGVFVDPAITQRVVFDCCGHTVVVRNGEPFGAFSCPTCKLSPTSVMIYAFHPNTRPPVHERRLRLTAGSKRRKVGFGIIGLLRRALSPKA